MNKSHLSERLITQLRDIVGSDGLVCASDDVDRESKTCIPFRQVPQGIVYPRSATEVQRIVTLAKETGIPLWPVSTGKNWGYGEKSAHYAGGLTLVLNRMRRIEHVDEELGYAVIEPGVTYYDLNEHLKRERIALWSDCAGTTPFASVIGNALDKGRGLTPYADHFASICGMEVVLADGSLLRTGNVTETPNKIWNLYKWGVGPYLDGLFAQSNFGIVVRAGVWLMPAPRAFDFLAFEYTALLGLFPEFIDDLRRLVFQGVLRSRPHLANDFAMLCIVSQYPKQLLIPGERTLRPDAIARWRKEHGIGAWTFGCGLYGSQSEVRTQRRAMRKALQKYGRLWSFGVATRSDWLGRLAFGAMRVGARMAGKSREFLAQIEPAANLFRGIPTDRFVRQVYVKSHPQKPSGAFDPPKDQCGFVWIGPLVPFRSLDVEKVLEIGRNTCAKYEFDLFVEIIIESPRVLIVLFGVFYDKGILDEEQRASQWYVEMREKMIEAGYPPYRETAQSFPHTWDRNTTCGKLLAAIKDAVDKNDLIAPGRYGIR